MEEYTDGISVAFDIDASGAFGQVQSLDDLVGSVTANMIRDIDRVKKASGVMFAGDTAVAAVNLFGSSTDRAMAQAERSMGQVERAVARLSTSLDRQISTFGISRDEIQANKVETEALAAEQKGLTDIAERLRGKQAQLADMQREAAAAAQQEADATRAAAQAYQMFEAVARQKAAAYREQQQLAAAAAREDRDLAAAAERLRAELDPGVAAQQRFNTEMARAQTLIGAGKISLDEYVAKLRVERVALAEVTDAHGKSANAVNANRSALAAIAPQAQDAFTQFSMGANVLSVLAIQGGQAAGQMTHMEGAAGSFARFMMGPWGLAVTAGLLVVGSLTENLFKAGSASDDLGNRQAALGADLDRTTGKIKEQVTWLSVLANSRDAEAKLQQGAGAYRSAQQQFTQSGRLAGVRFMPDQEPVDTVSTRGRALINDQLSRYNGGYNGGLSAEQVIRNLNAAAKTDATLKPAIATLETYAFKINDASNSNRTLQVQVARTAVAMGTATAEQKRLVASSTELAGSASQLINKQVALATATTPLEKARAQLALVQDRATAADRAGGAALEQYRKDMTAASSAVHVAEAAEKAHGAALRDSRRAASAARKEENRAEQLARDAAATEAQIRNLYGLSDAYELSGGAALMAEAKVKAESKAIKERADIDAETDRQVRLAIAQRVSGGEQVASTLRAQATVQAKVNEQVAAGLVPASQAAEMVRDQMADLPLLAALQAATATKDLEAITKVKDALKGQQDARAKAEEAATGAQFNQDMAGADDQIAMLREQLRLVTATEAVRTEGLATLRAQQEGMRLGYKGADLDAYVAKQKTIVGLQGQIADASNARAGQLTFEADKWDLIARNVQRAGEGMADAFGAAGRAVGDLTTIFAGFHADRARLDQEHKAAIDKAGKSETQIARETAKYAIQTSTLQIGAYGDMASAAKGFFSENSKGYEILSATEQAYRAIQFAMSVQAMAQNVAETLGFVSNSAAKATAAGTEGIANQSKLVFPFNILAMAATAGALVAAGVAVVGAISGGGQKAQPTNTGTGTVLGDTSAKSESLKRAIDELKAVDTINNVYSRGMLESLRSIDSQISRVAAVIVRGGDINASSGVAQGFKPNLIGSVLGSIPLVGGILSSLFGTRTDVTGSGIYGGAQSVGSVLNGGFTGQAYSDVTKTKKFLGIVTGRSSSTEYGALDPSLSNQFTLILRSFNDAIKAAAGPLGQSTDEIEQRLNGFVVNIGKIDLKGLTGEQIQEKLNAVFGAAADNMATAAFPLIAQFQKVGEGAFETLTRVATTVEQVSTSLDLLGASAKGMSIAAKLGLADQFDSVSALNDAASAYFQAFYTSEEQAAAKTAQMGKVFASLGASVPPTLAAFRQLVEVQDLTTAAGQATYATLLKLAPAFADLQSSMQGAKSAADILSERQDLERQILELQGKTDEIRKLDLAKLDASNRALQLQVWAIQDAQEATKAADELRQAWSSVGDSIMDEVKRIRGLGDVGGSTTFAGLLGQFNAATAAARGGDQDAAKSLPQLSQALLSAAANAATSRQELARVQAQTAASLEATYGAINKLGTVATATSDSALLAAAATAQTATSGSNDNAATIASLQATIVELKDEVKQMRTENNAGHAATAANTGKAAKVLTTAQDAAGGVGIGTRAVA